MLSSGFSTNYTSPFTRREMLASASTGFGAMALNALVTQNSYGMNFNNRSAKYSLAPKPTHHFPKAKRVVFFYIDGGISHVDSFDPKPQLAKEDGQPFKMKIQPTQFDEVGMVLKSPWKFSQYGESGIPISELFPNVAKHADDLAVVRSLTAPFSEHTNANYFLHTGHGLQGRPSMGSWFTYGLGTESENLPGFVVLNGGLIPPGGLDCFHNGFLPATFQGSVFKSGKTPLADLTRTEKTDSAQLRKLNLLRQLDQQDVTRSGAHDELESAIKNYELAFKMQTTVPELVDLSQETKQTQTRYGLDSEYEHTQSYARQCLTARRLLESGVRFIELTCPNIGGLDRWDQHSNLKKGHALNSKAVDQPIGALISDLKERGLFEDTLLVFSGEFGRTPMAQGKNGRDHNPFGFSAWMAGGGIKGGTIYGATDEYGYHAIENKLQIHDLHATMLHLLGVDHTRLTVRHSSRDMRLTDVHGKVITEIIS